MRGGNAMSAEKDTIRLLKYELREEQKKNEKFIEAFQMMAEEIMEVSKEFKDMKEIVEKLADRIK